MKKILTVHVNFIAENEVHSKDVTIKQIIFDGRVEGEDFQGMIAQGAVDTQTIYPDGSGQLSARYAVEGTDREGKSCRLYIDNRAELGSDCTTPRIVTDSEALEWLNTAKLCGKMVTRYGEFLIEIYHQQG